MISSLLGRRFVAFLIGLVPLGVYLRALRVQSFLPFFGALLLLSFLVFFVEQDARHRTAKQQNKEENAQSDHDIEKRHITRLLLESA